MSPMKILFLLYIIIFSSKCSDESSFIEMLKGFIQNNISNDFLIKVIEIIRHRNKHDFPDNFAKNQEAFKSHTYTIRRNKGYIEDQNSYTDMQYGIKPISDNGCGLIATYNVIFHITNKLDIDFPSIIKALENDGIILSGVFGTSMVAIDDYLKGQGYRTWSSSKKEDFDKIGQATEASILTVFNSVDDITRGMHFMAITKTNGQFYVHNNGNNSSKTAYNSITDVLNRINGGKAKEVYLTGVYKK